MTTTQAGITIYLAVIVFTILLGIMLRALEEISYNKDFRASEYAFKIGTIMVLLPVLPFVFGYFKYKGESL